MPNSVHTCGLASSSGYVSSDEELTSSAAVAVGAGSPWWLAQDYSHAIALNSLSAALQLFYL